MPGSSRPPRSEPPRVIQITDALAVPDRELLARIEAGGPWLAVQLRDPQRPARDQLAWGRRLREATRQAGARLLVNDRLDLALLLEADGIHLGRHSMSPTDARRALPHAFVTRSAHGVDEVIQNAAAGAQASLLSPIFSSPNKGPALGLPALDRASATMPRDHRLYALGGVDFERAPTCLAAGAHGVAAIRADPARLWYAIRSHGYGRDQS